MTSLVFFGSFQHYSATTLKIIHQSGQFNILGAITLPGNPVETYCLQKHLPCYTANFDTIPNIPQPDFVLVCGFGKLINEKWLNFPQVMPINIHQSLLPNYAGRFPVEWAILNGETTAGLTFIKMNEKFDKGDIIQQYSVPLDDTSTREAIYQKLYELAGAKTVELLPLIVTGNYQLSPQTNSGFYARQITREDGYIEATTLLDTNNFQKLDRMLRALSPWPGVWTHIYSKDRKKLIMKLFSADNKKGIIELQKVQIEGKKPTFWSEISQYYSLK
ncbi:hypothetical protein KBC75_04780 [Candidatus Shapirobacteria bacterium]|nr:hypothetical protein [Candidatus Shapirobacteria bacterium]